MLRIRVTAATLAALMASCTGGEPQPTDEQSAAVCCGANCCNIGGSCVGRGEINPGNNCQTCNPSSSQFNWSPVQGCTPADAGMMPPPFDGGANPQPDATIQDAFVFPDAYVPDAPSFPTFRTDAG